MKKLLVILLLLFPVHGAWAAKIHIKCIINGKTMYGKDIDAPPLVEEEKKETFRFVIDGNNLYERHSEDNDKKIKLDKYTIIDKSLSWENAKGSLYTSGTINREKGTLFYIRILHTSQGMFTFTGTGDCEKYDGKDAKKKF